jgi:hypothetical protein
MAFWKDEFVKKRRIEWMKSIYSIEAKVGATYYRGTIQKKEIVGDTVVIQSVFSSLGSGTVTITSVRVIDVDGIVAGEQAENITKLEPQGVIFKFEFPIREGV